MKEILDFIKKILRRKEKIYLKISEDSANVYYYFKKGVLLRKKTTDNKKTLCEVFIDPRDVLSTVNFREIKLESYPGYNSGFIELKQKAPKIY